MTQFFLLYFKDRDEYAIRTMGLGHRYVKIPRKEGMSDDEFKTEAIRQFDKYVANDQVIEADVIKTSYVF
jgi:hypothetical protein